jgi:hypothetical protein
MVGPTIGGRGYGFAWRHAVKAKIHSRIVAPKPSFWREPELLHHRPWWARPGMAGGGQGGRWLDRKQAPRLPVGTGYAPTVRGCSGRRHCPLLRLQARIPCHSVPFRAVPQRWAVDSLPLGRAACQRWQGASAGALGARGRVQPCRANHTAGPGGPTRAWQAWQEVGGAATGWIASRHPACPRAPAMPPRCAAALAGAIAPCCGCRRAFCRFPPFSTFFHLAANCC